MIYHTSFFYFRYGNYWVLKNIKWQSIYFTNVQWLKCCLLKKKKCKYYMAAIIQLINNTVISTFKQKYKIEAPTLHELRRKNFINHFPRKRMTESCLFNTKRIMPQNLEARICLKKKKVLSSILKHFPLQFNVHCLKLLNKCWL